MKKGPKGQGHLAIAASARGAQINITDELLAPKSLSRPLTNKTLIIMGPWKGFSQSGSVGATPLVDGLVDTRRGWQGFHELDRYGENDGRVLLGGNVRQSLKIS